MSQPSLSSETNNEPKQPKPWLLKHYQEKRQRTVTLVKAAVDHLANEQQTVTIEAICSTSSTLDPEGRGVKKSAVLENPEAHAYYRKHSTSYQTMKQRNRKLRRKPSAPDPLRIDPNRDVDRARYRYQHMTNAELVERLLIVEQAYAEVHQQLTQLQFEMLETQQQRAHRKKGEKERGDSISAAQ